MPGTIRCSESQRFVFSRLVGTGHSFERVILRKQKLLNPKPPRRGADAANGKATSRAKFPALSSTDFPQMAVKPASPEAVKKKKPSLLLCLTEQDIDF